MANDSSLLGEGFSIYSLTTGEIRVQVGAYITALGSLRDGEAVFAGRWDDRLWWIDSGALSERPKLFAQDVVNLPADGVTEFVVTDIPAGAMIKIDREAWQPIVDGTFEFVSAFPGEWAVEILPPFPFQQQKIRIVVNAA